MQVYKSNQQFNIYSITFVNLTKFYLAVQFRFLIYYKCLINFYYAYFICIVLCSNSVSYGFYLKYLFIKIMIS